MIKFHILILNAVSLLFRYVVMMMLSALWLMARSFTHQYELICFTYASSYELPYGTEC